MPVIEGSVTCVRNFQADRLPAAAISRGGSSCWKLRTQVTEPSITGIVVDIQGRLAVIGYAGFAGKDIIRYHSPPHLLTQLNLRLVGLKLAPADQDGAAIDLQRVAPFMVAVPLHEGAVAKPHRALARDFRNLVAGPPKGAVHKSQTPRVIGVHAHHRRVGAVEGDELAIRNEHPERSTVLHNQGGVTIIRANAEEIAIAQAASGLYELIANVIAKAKGVEDVLPVTSTEDKGLPMRLLPLEQARLYAPPGVEMHVLDTSDVEDHVHEDASPQWLAMHVPNQVALIVAGIDAIIGVEQFDGEHGGVLPAHRNRPGIGIRLLCGVLLGIIDNHPL